MNDNLPETPAAAAEPSVAGGRPLAVLLVVAGAALLLLVALGNWTTQRDDSYIFYTYARNIAEGRGFVFNEGERVNACTSTLYPLLLAGLQRLLGWIPGVTFPVLGHLVGALGLVLSTSSLAFIFRGGAFPFLPLILPFLLLASPWLPLGAGMESYLTMGLALLTILLYGRRRLVWAGFVFGLTVLSRPDTLLVGVVLGVDYLWRTRRWPPLAAILAALATLLPWAVFARLYYGAVLPSTLAAKMYQTETAVFGGAWPFLEGLAGVYPERAITSPTLWALGLSLIVLLFVDRSWIRDRSVLLLLSWSALYLLAYGLVINPPAYLWYYTPLALPTSLLMALGIDRLLARIPLRRPVVAALAVIAVVAAYGGATALERFREPYNAKYLYYRKAAAWLNRNAPPGATMGTNEVGILGFYYRRGKVIDGLGLITPPVAEHVRRRDYAWYLHQYRPDFLVFAHPHRPDLESMVEEEWFRREYDLATIVAAKGRKVAIWKRSDTPTARN